MPVQPKSSKPAELVKKPIICGSFHGADAWKLALKRILSFVGITILYVLVGAMLGFDSQWISVIVSVLILAATAYYQYTNGVQKGVKDATYGEILYNRREAGHTVTDNDCERSFHRLKGFFAVLVASVPFVLLATIFALKTEKIGYKLGVLPSWTASLMEQSSFGEALAYYNTTVTITAMDVMRVIIRMMVMPFVNIVKDAGADAMLLVERLSPLLILVTPIWYGIGYTQGRHQRDLINTGIKMGDDRKKRREKKARKQRQHSKTPERLI